MEMLVHIVNLLSVSIAGPDCVVNLTLTTQSHQKIIFLEIFFRILNMFTIVSNLQKKNFNFCQNPQK